MWLFRSDFEANRHLSMSNGITSLINNNNMLLSPRWILFVTDLNEMVLQGPTYTSTYFNYSIMLNIISIICNIMLLW